MSRSNYVHLEGCTLSALTTKAALVVYDGEQHWIPLSQLAEGEEAKLHKIELKHEEFTLSISAWIAEQKGIETDE